MIAANTSWHALHRQLVSNANRLDSNDRGRLTRMMRPGDLLIRIVGSY